MTVSSLMAWFRNFLHDYGPWITMSLIPSLIVGLSKSPKTKVGADFLKIVLQYLSILAPSDAPGTFKMPLTAPHRPKDGGKPPASVASFLLPVLFVGALTTSSGCSWLSSVIGSSAGKDIIACEGEAVMSEVANLLPTVKAILTGGAVDWKKQLDIFKQMGEDALACALQVAANDLQNASNPPTDKAGDSPEKMKARAGSAEGARKANEYLKTQGYKFKGK